MRILHRGLGCFETIWASSRKQLSYNSLKLLQNGLNFHNNGRNAWRKQRKAFSSLQKLNGKHVTGGPWWGAWSSRAAPVANTRANIPRDLPTLYNVSIARTPENNSYDKFSWVLTIPASSCTPKLASSQAVWLGCVQFEISARHVLHELYSKQNMLLCFDGGQITQYLPFLDLCAQRLNWLGWIDFQWSSERFNPLEVVIDWNL